MRFFLTAGALMGFLGVALGAFGAHGLRGRLEPRMLEIFHTGVTYQMYHTLALIAFGALLHWYPANKLLIASGYSFLVGILIFSGSLYILALTGIGWLGAITPLGGLAFLLGWALLFNFAMKLP
jgi:uncharacterized membrane protein YgdD (TMEM256/DUF423 family)